MQVYWVLKHGTSLAQRWEADDDGVNLYHCADEGRGFFVEVGVDYSQEQPIVLRSFVSSVPLEDYSHYVRLPEGGYKKTPPLVKARGFLLGSGVEL